MPVNVNTPIKVIGFGGTAFVVLFGASYLVVSVLDLHGDAALYYVLGVVLLAYLGSFIGSTGFIPR
jgi:hypothetical protein